MENDNKTIRQKVLRDPVNLLAYGLGSGLSPIAPGTAGSLVGLALAWGTMELPMTVRLMVAIALIVSGVWICGESARRIGVHDHGGIVWDEICGMYITLLLAPATVLGFALGFGLFRLFDIVKPSPIRELDHRLGGGLGIMLDDLVAALYALILLALYGWLMT